MQHADQSILQELVKFIFRRPPGVINGKMDPSSSRVNFHVRLAGELNNSSNNNNKSRIDDEAI